MAETIFKIILVIALILVLITAYLIFNVARKRKNSITCNGTITGFEENTSEVRLDDYENKAISPVVEYEVNNKSYKFTGNFYSTSMKVGDSVEVLCNKDDNSKATIKKGIVLAPLITGVLPFVFFVSYIIWQLVFRTQM